MMTPEKKLGVRFIIFWLNNKVIYLAIDISTKKYLDRCSTKGIKMFKLVPLFILLCFLPVTSFAEYGGNSRSIPLQTFKDRFTTGELMLISTAYAEDAHIRAAVSNLKSMAVINLDSDVIKKDVSYLASKSILSEDRARDILK